MPCTVYPKKYAHGFVVLCFVSVMQSFVMNSHEVIIHIHQSCFAGTGAIVRLPQYQWSKPDGNGKISQCITTTKHRKAKIVCIFLGIYGMTYSFQWYRHLSCLKHLQSWLAAITWFIYTRSIITLANLTLSANGCRTRYFDQTISIRQAQNGQKSVADISNYL